MHKWLCWVLALFCFTASFKTEARSITDSNPGKAIFFKQSSAKAISSADTVKTKKSKLIAALLAFPFPCGVIGLHRAYLHSAGGMPLVYVATIGGGFGILPFIDFVLIVLNKDVNHYAYNTRLFMWTRKKKN
ncbi:MAG TPA: TM2 domain-containing protein [Bacteroidia bacterium]|jgi:TM2 domain-containing membrane protein YozV|nr:TM2 domain-containing protein [Bacteroidia bacterium]